MISSFHNHLDLFLCCYATVMPSQTLHPQTECLSNDSLLCMICHHTTLLLFAWERVLLMTPRWTQQNVEMKSDVYSWTTMPWWGKTGRTRGRRATRGRESKGKLDWKGRGKAGQQNVEEIEINQKCEKEMIYWGKMEKTRQKQGEAVREGGRWGSSEEEISCFLMGTDYISS